MNRKLYGISLAAVFLAVSFLTSCSSSSHSHTTPPPPAATPFAFYLSGQDNLPASSGDQNYYALAGAVTIDASGNVTGGEQDYNEGFTSNGGIQSPEPSGDSITGGTLTIDATGQGTLTLVTNNTALGSSGTPGTETLAVQFVNANHALITQFDGSATSSGSMDLQTLSGTPSGGFAFTVSGVDPNYNPFAAGGVFTLPSAASDVIDVNDAGTVVNGTLLTVSLGTADAFGRGTVTSSTGILFNYYVVGPEVVRIIDVDATDAAVGSAFGQGTNATAATNASLPNSVFAASGNPWSGIYYGTAGQITTVSSTSPGTFTGVGEEAELETFISGAASLLAGSYSIAPNGYGNLTIGGFGGGNVSAFQVYATDPTLNLMDPNNTSGGGGVLLLDTDDALAGGTGVAIPQTDPTSTDFNGTYTAAWQDFNALLGINVCDGCEFDMVSQGTMASGGALSINAEISDPFETLAAGGSFGPGTFTGTPTPDTVNAGRFTLLSPPAGASLTASIGTSPYTSFDAIIYQASASQLFWLEFDLDSVFVGPLEVQGSLSGLPTVARPVKAQAKRW